MTRHGFLRLAAIVVLCAAATPVLGEPGVQSFDADWRFLKGDAEGAEAVDFDDAAWRSLDVPHDWSIEGPYDRDAAVGRGGSYLPSGVGWYRKTFKLAAENAERKVFVEFDGVMSHSTVWVNGKELGQRPFGYASFRYELAPHLKFGEGAENLIAVRVDNTRQPASRWYAGAGIYRHTRLVTEDASRIEPWATFVTTPKVTADQATIDIKTAITYAAPKVETLVTVLRPDGSEVGGSKSTTEAAADAQDIDQDPSLREESVTENNPQLWSPKSPNLYTAVIEVRVDGKLVDSQRIRFGIREFRFEADTGFWLNGENMKIKGVCLHHDGGAVGAAVPKAVWRRRLETLKTLGVNGIRTAHNPASPEFLDLCDELGFVVMHEVFDCWNSGKNNAQNGYNREFSRWWQRDQTDAVLRDRNHPSIILYSMGNEIRDNLRSPEGFAQFKAMKALNKELDGTRPVTMAVFRPNQSGVYDSGFSELMDVVGQNYRENELVEAHRDKPTRKIIGTENSHERSVWLMMRDNPFYAGQFLWTGIEYMGESDWPYTTWVDALVDRAGFVKPMGLERQSWWSEEPMVAIVRNEAASGGSSGRGRGETVDHWTPRDPDTYDEARVTVYSNCEEVKLVLNGASVGKETMPDDARPATFRVPYEPGTVEAVGFNEGKEVARQTLRSADFPAKLKVTADRDSCSTDFDDVVHVTVEVVDAEGVRCPWDDSMVSIQIEGPGKLIGIDNADPQSHESFQEPQRRAFNGRVLAIVRATDGSGEFTVRATAEGLEAGEAVIRAVRMR